MTAEHFLVSNQKVIAQPTPPSPQLIPAFRLSKIKQDHQQLQKRLKSDTKACMKNLYLNPAADIPQFTSELLTQIVCVFRHTNRHLDLLGNIISALAIPTQLHARTEPVLASSFVHDEHSISM